VDPSRIKSRMSTHSRKPSQEEFASSLGRETEKEGSGCKVVGCARMLRNMSCLGTCNHVLRTEEPMQSVESCTLKYNVLD
jgi:hypothetical protein